MTDREPQIDEATPTDVVERENGEAALPPEDEGAGEDARRHAQRLERHNRPNEDPADPTDPSAASPSAADPPVDVE